MGRRLLLQGELNFSDKHKLHSAKEERPAAETGKRHRNSINLFGKEVWIMKAIEAVKAGEAECLEKDGVIVYKPKADVNVRIDIKNKQ